MTGFHYIRRPKRIRASFIDKLCSCMRWREDLDMIAISMNAFNHVRRLYLLTFRKRYVLESLKNRKGSCIINCGACCNDGRCEYLSNHKTCRIYDIRICHRPFPIDSTEKRLLGVDKECGYWWKND